MRNRLIMALALAAFVAVPAMADADEGFFIGGSIGQGFVDTNITDGIGGAITLDDEDFSYKLVAGYRIGKWMAVEGSYVDLGKVTDSSGANVVSAETSGFDVYGVGILPVGPFDLFAKVGVFFADSDISGSTVMGDTDTTAAYGVGAAFRLGSFGIRLEWEHFDVDVPDSYDLVSAGLTFTF